MISEWDQLRIRVGLQIVFLQYLAEEAEELAEENRAILDRKE